MAEAGGFLLAEVMLWLMYAVATVAVVVTVVSAVRPFFIAPRRNAGMRGWLTVALTALLLLATYLMASDKPLVINGMVYSDGFWLQVTDMFILSSGILMMVASLSVLYGVSGINRKLKIKRKG